MSNRSDAMRSHLEAALDEPLGALGLDLEAVEITPAGRRRVLRIAVDGDGGVSLDQLGEATRAVSSMLDDTDVMGEQPYVLEVTSRGVDRPLTLPRHWRRNVDRLVQVTLADQTTLTGRVVASDDAGVRLDPEDGTGERALPYDDVTTALVQVELNRRGREPAGQDRRHEDEQEEDD